ncbi:unnamed protein product [Ixodes hexagonus]
MHLKFQIEVPLFSMGPRSLESTWSIGGTFAIQAALFPGDSFQLVSLVGHLRRVECLDLRLGNLAPSCLGGMLRLVASRSNVHLLEHPFKTSRTEIKLKQAVSTVCSEANFILGQRFQMRALKLSFAFCVFMREHRISKSCCVSLL